MPKVLGIDKFITGDLVQDGIITEANLISPIKNIVVKEYFANDNWVAPAGVTQVEVLAKAIEYQASAGRAGLIDGTMYSWGVNSFGTVGDGTTEPKSSPVLVVGGLKFKQVTAGIGSYCALTLDGTAYCWGQNGQGQLGDGTILHRSSPVLVVGGLKFKQIDSTTAFSTTAILADGTAYCWGQNFAGHLGDGTTINRSSPVLVVGGLKFKQVTMSIMGFNGVTADGTAYTSGSNIDGDLGDGTTISRSSPVLVIGGLKFNRISLGHGITADGTAYGWGENRTGQLGDGTTEPKSSPVLVVGGLKFKSITNSLINTYGLTLDGSIYSWGSNGTSGSLGDGTTISRSSPVLVVGGLKFKQIGANIGITSEGDAYVWGSNSATGTLGDGTILNRSSPVLVIGGLKFTPHTTQSIPTKQTFNVVPGQSYSIKISDYIAKFDNTSLDINAGCESITLKYMVKIDSQISIYTITSVTQNVYPIILEVDPSFPYTSAPIYGLWVTGNNAGLTFTIDSNADTILTTGSTIFNTIQIGDTFKTI